MAGSEATEPILRRLFRAAGYRLEPRAPGLYAFRARDRRAVLIVENRHSPAELAGEFDADALHRTLIYPEDPGPVARDAASRDGMEVLDSTTIGPGLGELLLPTSAEASEAGSPGTIALEAPTSLFPDGARTVQARLGAPDAEVIAGVEGLRTRLKLVPFFVAAYRVRVPSPTGSVGPASDHIVAVNALTGQVELWEPGEREIGAETETAAEEFPPRLSESECRELAQRELRSVHTISVDHTEQHGGTIVIERRKVPPGPGDLKLGVGVFLWVPYWYVEGREGRFVIDAVSGSRNRADTLEAR